MPVHLHPNVVYAAGSQVVLRDVIETSTGHRLHPAGAVGTVVASPRDRTEPYRVRMADGSTHRLMHEAVDLLKAVQDVAAETPAVDLTRYVILDAVIGSRAYGLHSEDSDTDRRGAYLPPAELHWSLAGAPEQIEDEREQTAYWELEKFLRLLLKANPNSLEALHSPEIVRATPVGEELIANRGRFLSRLVYQTVNGYAASQFKKMEADLRNHGGVRWKHAMHLIRLLIGGRDAVRTGELRIRVEDDVRETLLSIKRGERTWDEVAAMRRKLHAEFDAALDGSPLPERGDAAWANDFLIRSRRSMA